MIPGLGFLGHPLRKQTIRGADTPLRVANERDVKTGQARARDRGRQRQDAWMRLDKVTLGSLWLVRASENGPIKSFSTVCPHLGCGIDFNDKLGKFDCPCHDSTFDLDGRCLGGPSPRGLDELEARVEGRDVLVRYRRFRVGSAKREPIG